MTYLDKIKEKMKRLSDLDYWLIGQNTTVGGTSMYHTYKDYFEGRKLELPVAEEMQCGLGTGMSLTGLKILSVYPRFDFFLLALNQLVNHLDKAEEMSDGQFKPKQIFRVCVGSTQPMMPGPQHCQNYTEAIKRMVTNIEVRELLSVEDVEKYYEEAINSDKSYILIEHSDLYNKDFAFKDIKESKEK